MTPEDKKLLAILIAMREPTRDMVYDATNASYCAPDTTRVVWRAMIDRMMSELCKGEAGKWDAQTAAEKEPKRARNRKTRNLGHSMGSR